MAEEYEITIQDPAKGQNATLMASGVIDVIEEVTHSLNSKVTDVPLEDGSSIVDHVRDTPKKVTLTIAVSNSHTQSPLIEKNTKRMQEIRGKFASIDPRAIDGFSEVELEALIDESNISISSYDEVKAGRPKVALSELIDLKNSRQRVTISSFLYEYIDMIIDRISFSESAKTSSALFASVSFRQIKFATSTTDTLKGTKPVKEELVTLKDIQNKNKALEDARQKAIQEEKDAIEAEAQQLEADKQKKIDDQLREAQERLSSPWYLRSPWSMFF